MNILQIGKFYPPYKGGMETVLQDISEGLAEQRINVRVICSSESLRFSFEKKSHLEIIKYPTVAIIASQPICPSLLLKLRSNIKWADIIHIHSPNPILEFAVLILSGKKKIICTHHSDIFRQRILKFCYIPFWNIFKKRVNKFIVPTINHIKYSDMANDIKEKTSIIPFGIKNEKYLPTLEDKKIFSQYFLFVGRLVEYKGLKYLLEAMKSVNSNLIIIGRGHLIGELQDYIKDNLLEEKVKILTEVESQEQLNSFYKNAYALILPSISKNENFGIVQLEAMYFSLPIITTNIKSGVPLVGIPGETTLLIEPENPNELASAITTLLENPSLATEMGKMGRVLFDEKYTYSQMIKEHIKVYKSLLNER